MSWVFLTEARAYKLKKPQRTRWFDLTTRAARLRACEREVRLNRRLSPEVYVGVVPITAGGGRIRVDGDGAPIDWLVEMRRLPASVMLDAQLERGRVDRARVRRAAGLLSSFYLGAEPAGWSGHHYRGHLAGDLAAKTETLADPRYEVDRAVVDAVTGALRERLHECAALLDERAPWVADVHGDLRPEHIYLGDQPAVIDCLDFSRALRLLDPVSELAFLALECRRLGAPQVGSWFLDGYAAATGDHAPPELVPLYQAYHAVVRATIAAWHLDDAEVDHTSEWRNKALRYLELGGDILERQ